MSTANIALAIVWIAYGICIAVKAIDYRKQVKQWREEHEAFMRKGR